MSDSLGYRLRMPRCEHQGKLESGPQKKKPTEHKGSRGLDGFDRWVSIQTTRHALLIDEPIFSIGVVIDNGLRTDSILA